MSRLSKSAAHASPGRVWRSLLLAGAVLVAACDRFPTPGPTAAVPAPTADTPPAPASQVAPEAPTPTSIPAPARVTLRLWTSPDAAPDETSPGGPALAGQLQAFEAANPNVSVEVRVKKTSGAGSLLDFLRTASAAAPAVLPDVIALSRDDLSAASGEGLVQPVGPVLPPDALADFYPMAVEAARGTDGELYGLPFYAEGTVLVYNTEQRATPPITWTDVLSPTSTFLLPLGDPLGLVTLQQYYALGGAVKDASGDLALDASLLAAVLDFYHTAAAAGVLPPNSGDYADPASTWSAYRDNRAALAAAPAGLYLRERGRAGATAARWLPTRDGVPLAVGTAWSYALVTADPVRQPIALALMQWLTAPANIGEWSQAAGALPPRASALDAWDKDLPAAFAGELMPVAVLQPGAADLAILGLPLKQAVADALAGRVTPQTAAERAAAAIAAQ
jgi:ABC-type glycerol-3-phosphate transport system substrate-binding protein